MNVNWLMQEMKTEVPDRLKVVVFINENTDSPFACNNWTSFDSLIKVSEVLAFEIFEGF